MLQKNISFCLSGRIPRLSKINSEFKGIYISDLKKVIGGKSFDLSVPPLPCVKVQKMSQIFIKIFNRIEHQSKFDKMWQIFK